MKFERFDSFCLIQHMGVLSLWKQQNPETYSTIKINKNKQTETNSKFAFTKLESGALFILDIWKSKSNVPFDFTFPQTFAP